MAFRPTVSYDSLLPELKSVEEVTQKVEENKLVLILFNKKYPLEDDLEQKFNSWRDIYEKTYDLHIYRCVISVLKNQLKTEYKITKVPTFIFFHQGKEINRLEDVEKVDPNQSASPEKPEEKLHAWLDHCCTNN